MAKVLVIDDSLSVRKVVERALVGRQIEVVCAATGTEALERIEREAPDIVVCDVVMPDRDGYEICEYIKRHPRLSRTPVLLMSGIVNDEVRARAARVQSADVLSKPFAAEDLVRRLEALLAAGARGVPAGAGPTFAPAVSGTNGHTIPTITPAPPAESRRLEPPVIQPRRPEPPPIAPRAPVTPVAKPAAASTSTSQAILSQFVAIEGVQWAVLADREGFLLASDGAVDPEIAGALSSCLAESSEGLGRELGRGALQSLILEYEQGMIVLYSVGTSALLAIGLSEAAVLGKVRYYAKKTVPELIQVV